jgi:hypothetical protein
VAIKGVAYAINGTGVTPPDSATWPPTVIGQDLNSLQKRSPYRIHEWSKQVAGPCHLDWFDYDNTTLASLVTRPPGTLDEMETYTDAVLQSVTMRQDRNVGTQVTAQFLVYVGS